MKSLVGIVMTVIALALMSTGCHRHAGEAWVTMDIADAVMEADPDSARRLLDGIDPSVLTDDEEVARHALLTSMALDKCYIDLADDSIISKAVNYYSSRPLSREKMLSTYYLGRVMKNAGATDKALVYALETIEFSEVLKDTLIHARGDELAADIYRKSYSMDEAVKHRERAVKYYESIGRDKSAFWALCDLTGELNYLCETDRSSAIIDSLVNVIKNCEPADSNLLYELMGFSLFTEFSRKDYNALIAIGTGKERVGLSVLDMIYIATAYLKKGNCEKARVYIDKLENTNLPQDCILEVLNLRANLAERTGDFKKATILYDTILVKLNSQTRNIFRYNVNKARADYLQKSVQQKEIENKRQSEKNRIYMSSAILLILILIASAFVMVKRRNNAIRDKMVDLSILTDRVGGYIVENSLLKERLHKFDASSSIHSEGNVERIRLVNDFFGKHIRTINSLCAQFFDDDGSKASKSAIINQVNVELQELRNGDNISSIVSIVNEISGGVIDRIKINNPSFSDDDISFVSMVIAGLNTRIISTITGLKPQGVYSKKRRMLEKIKKSGIEDIDSFFLINKEPSNDNK